MENLDIKMMAFSSGVKLWEIARELGITDGSLSRKLRKKLSVEEEQKIKGIIDRICASRAKEG